MKPRTLNLLAFVAGILFLAGVVCGVGFDQMVALVRHAGLAWLLLVGTGLLVLAGDSLALKIVVGHPGFSWPRAGSVHGHAVAASHPADPLFGEEQVRLGKQEVLPDLRGRTEQ
jgi:hypothetical protein